MKLNVPFIGRVSTGKDTDPIEVVKEIPAKTKSSLFGGYFNMGKKLTSETVISDKLLQANRGWVYRNNDVIAKAVSELDPQLFRMKVTAGNIEFEEVDDHPLLDLLDRFNASLNRAEGFYLTQSHVKLAGDAFWYITEDQDKMPDQIFLLQPDKVTVRLGDFTDSTAVLIEGYTYKDRLQDEKGKTKEVKLDYEPDEVLHFKVPNPANPFRGKSAVEAAAEEIDTDNFSIETIKKFFENGAIVDFFLTTDQRVTAEQEQTLSSSFKNLYGGVRNAFKIPVLGGGLKAERITFSNKETELLKLQEWFRDKIMVMFGNTKASIGIIDDVNRASHESSIIAWRQDTVRPEMSRMVNTINEFLVPRYGEDLILGFKDPIPENRGAKVTEATQLKGSDIISQNEAREMLGFDTVEGGDEFSRERGERMASEFVSNLPKSLQYVDVKSHMRRTRFIEAARKGREVYKASRKIAKQMLKKEPTEVRIHEQFTNEEVWAYYEKQIKVTESIEVRFEQMIDTYLKELLQEALDNVKDALDKKKADIDLIDRESNKVKAQAYFAPLLSEAVVSAGNQANQLIERMSKKADPFIMSEVLRAFIKTSIDKFAESVIDTDEDKLVEIVVDGIKEGKSVPVIERGMRESFGLLAKSQATRITRTEVLRATNHAALESYKDSDVVVAKQWLTAGDPDETCAQYEGLVEELDGSFYKSDNIFQDGDPPLHPNCRCIILPVVEGAKSFDPSRLHKEKAMTERIKQLESDLSTMDKRTKKAKTLLSEKDEYIKELEALASE